MDEKKQSNSRIFLLTPDYQIPTGGIRSNYRIIDIFNRNGFSAYILHWKKGFRCEWFKNSTRIAYISEVQFTSEDYLLVPEVYGSDILDFDKNVYAFGRHILNVKGRIVILNRNSYMTFINYPISSEVRTVPYKSPDIMGAIVVSEDNKDYLQYAFPGLRIFRIHNSFDSNLFLYNSNKKKKICFMPRKLEDHVVQVINMLRYRDVLKDFELAPIIDKSIEETAAIMNESLIFLSFSYQEGFANPPAEAMLSGCIVIGYDGRGSKELFTPEFSYPIEHGDIIGYARTVEEVIRKYNTDADYFKFFTKNASDHIKKNYSPEREEADLCNAWESLTNIPTSS